MSSLRMKLLYIVTLVLAGADNMQRLRDLLNERGTAGNKREIESIGAQMKVDYTKALEKYLALKKGGFFGKRNIKLRFQEAAADYTFFLKKAQRFEEAETIQGQIKVVMEELDADNDKASKLARKGDIFSSVLSVGWLVVGGGSATSIMLYAFLISAGVIISVRLMLYMIQ